MTSSAPQRGAAATRTDFSAERGQGARRLLPSRARRSISVGAMARRRALVLAAKWLLPAGALALLAAVALWPEFDKAEDRGRLAFRRLAQTSAEALRVSAARYQGLDEQNRPYTVTATQAQQQESTLPIALTQPRADMVLGNGAWVLLEAKDGLYARDRNLLDLAGEVTLWHDNGSTLKTEAAHIDVKAGSAEGDRAVAAQGPFGTLTSQGFRLTERGAVVVFTGQAHAVLEGSK